MILIVITLMLAGYAQADNRVSADDHSPAWSQSVLRLRTPVARQHNDLLRHSTEHCTATLVKPLSDYFLLTAWHCIEGLSDLTRPPRVEIGGYWYPMEVLATGGSMLNDWAVLGLLETPPKLPPAVAIASIQLTENARVIAAGYSRDSGLGRFGETLTFHPDCQVHAAIAAGWRSDCLAYKGASGGPIMVTDSGGSQQIAGIISAGDSETVSIITPVSRLRATLHRLR